MVPDTHATSWLRNSLLVKYPDATLLLHLKETIPILGDRERFYELMDGYNWTLMQSAGEYDNSIITKVGVCKNYDDHSDKALQLLHISTGSFMVHLVGERSDDDFDRFAKHCYTEGL